jgi:hypothetical protein
MPLLFEVRDGRRSKYFLYEDVLKNPARSRRVVGHAMDELDAWRKKYRRLLESLEFAAWNELILLLDQVRGDRPRTSRTPARTRRGPRSVREAFHEAVAKIDAWQRTYGFLFERLKHAEGRKISEAVENVLRPRGQVFYAWAAENDG